MLAPPETKRGAARADRLGVALGVLTGILGLAACHRERPDPAPAPAPASAAPSAPPVDRLAAGELIAGEAKAFGLVLPRDVKIDHALGDVVFASGPMSASDLANYVRARVRDGQVTIGATATIFDHVMVTIDPSRPIFVRIFSGPMGRGARMEIRDLTPPPQPSGLSPDERWKRLGLTPEGKVLDPTHLE
jgi:hypothetical protein